MKNRQIRRAVCMGLFFLVFVPPLMKGGPKAGSAGESVEFPAETRIQDTVSKSFSVSLKLWAEVGHLVGQNDVNRYLGGWDSLLDYVAQFFDYTTGGNFSPLGIGPSFGGEVLLDFPSRFALGLGAGYTETQKKSTKIMNTGQGSLDFTLNPFIKSLPLTLTLYYTLLDSGIWHISLGAGISYHLGRYRGIMQQDLALGFTISSFEADSHSLGIQGGLKATLNLSRSLGLLFGIAGRAASFTDLVGTQTFYESGFGTPTVTESGLTLWYVEEEQAPGQYYANFLSSAEKPEGPWFRVVRKARIPLSQLGIRIGFVLRLGEIFRQRR